MNDYTLKIEKPSLRERWTIIKQCLFSKEIHIGLHNSVSLHPDFIKEIMEVYPTVLSDKYNITITDDSPLQILEKICKVRGYMLKGAECDYDRASMALINDFRKGKLGNITLEDVSQIKQLTVRDRKVPAEGKNE